MPKEIPHLVKKEIEEFLALEEQRLTKGREAADLEKLARVLKEKIWAYVEATGGTDRTCVRSGFVISLKTKAGSPSWKEEFLKVAGPVEAAKIVAETPKKDYLVVEPQR